MKFKEDDVVKLNTAGKVAWESQAPGGMTGIISNIDKFNSWGDSFSNAEYTIHVDWENDTNNCYPDTALELVEGVLNEYLIEEKELSLEELIAELT